MTDYSLDDRWQENNAARSFSATGAFSIWLIVIAVSVAIVGYRIVNPHSSAHIFNIFNDFYATISSEMISIVVTVVVIDGLNKRRDKQERELLQNQLDSRELAQLKALLNSHENVVTKITVAGLKAKGWLTDGSLEGTDLKASNMAGLELHSVNMKKSDLRKANLTETDLTRANLESGRLHKANLEKAEMGQSNLSYADLQDANLLKANLWKANLQETSLIKATLQEANLWKANLERANLMYANLQDANLSRANLKEALIEGAQLKGANLSRANLREAYLGTGLQVALFSEETTLPDGTNWTPDIDMRALPIRTTRISGRQSNT